MVSLDKITTIYIYIYIYIKPADMAELLPIKYLTTRVSIKPFPGV